LKKLNHFVWKHYLKPWTNKNGKIICKIEGKIHERSLNQLAAENYFYKLKVLTTDDLKFIEKIFINENNPYIFDTGKEWLKMFSWANILISLKEKINDVGIQNDLDKLTKEFNENIHNNIENTAIKYLELLYNKDVSFYETATGNIEFNIFICEQYFRTRDMKKRMIKMHTPIKNVNFENCWNIASHILAYNLAGTLSMEKGRFKCILLENNTIIPFYTSDQPLINIAADRNNIRELKYHEFEIYYPITPNIALLLCLKENLLGNNKSIIELDEIKVKNYNTMVTSQGGSILFSNARSSFT
jgi:hypothetical protein